MVTNQYNFGLGLSGAEAQEAGRSLEREIKQTESFKEALEKAQSDEELKTACTEFETYFVNTIFKEMRKTVTTFGTEKSFAENYYQEMLDEEYSKKAANNGGIGLAKFLYEQLSGGQANTYSSLRA